ncbi:MAG: response regulator [Firmicutes bacterium]|nr:response regulator [Bacillota bacterium]
MERGKLRILVADDQAGVRYLFDILIKETGHVAYLAQNGLEAVKMACLARPDLVFMDVRMPLMDGLEALGRIKEVRPETDVVIMTAYGSEETMTEAIQKGALCCMTKPFDIGDLKAFLARYCWERTARYRAVAGECAY